MSQSLSHSSSNRSSITFLLHELWSIDGGNGWQETEDRMNIDRRWLPNYTTDRCSRKSLKQSQTKHDTNLVGEPVEMNIPSAHCVARYGTFTSPVAALA